EDGTERSRGHAQVQQVEAPHRFSAFAPGAVPAPVIRPAHYRTASWNEAMKSTEPDSRPVVALSRGAA
ncbi:MAG TPA: hypothetical protein VFS85_02625, partial [Dongiaceae bacterium]|nr:hypothetical protein [Dongiaceae bacterium]